MIKIRLWHIDLVNVLPRQQLVAEWRELNSIFKKQDNHILINFVYDCPKEHLMYYTNLIIDEFHKRGYKIKSFDNYNTYFEGIQAPVYIAPCNLFYGKMNDRYLRQCLYNLQEKFDCKGITEEEWSKIYDKFRNKFGIQTSTQDFAIVHDNSVKSVKIEPVSHKPINQLLTELKAEAEIAKMVEEFIKGGRHV